jgi:hypothetical protein
MPPTTSAPLFPVGFPVVLLPLLLSLELFFVARLERWEEETQHYLRMVAIGMLGVGLFLFLVVVFISTNNTSRVRRPDYWGLLGMVAALVLPLLALSVSIFVRSRRLPEEDGARDGWAGFAVLLALAVIPTAIMAFIYWIGI